MRLTAEELAGYHEDGYVVRPHAFTAEEVAALRTASEQVCDAIAANADPSRRHKVSEFYVFEQDAVDNTIIKWEPGDDRVIQGLEPVVHLHPKLAGFAAHPAFVGPMLDILGLAHDDDVALFTEKLDVKRAPVGGGYALHRDYPYWQDSAEQPDRLVTGEARWFAATAEADAGTN